MSGQPLKVPRRYQDDVRSSENQSQCRQLAYKNMKEQCGRQKRQDGEEKKQQNLARKVKTYEVWCLANGAASYAANGSAERRGASLRQFITGVCASRASLQQQQQQTTMSGSGKGLLGLWLYRTGEEWALKDGPPRSAPPQVRIWASDLPVNCGALETRI